MEDRPTDDTNASDASEERKKDGAETVEPKPLERGAQIVPAYILKKRRLETTDAIHVRDYKTGRWPVAKPRSNAQVQFLGLAAAKAFGASSALCDITYVKPNGSVKVDEPYEMGMFDLQGFGDMLHENYERRVAAKKTFMATQSPNNHFIRMFLKSGNQCRFCPARKACPKAR